MYRLNRIPMVITTILALSACGISGNLRTNPGYVDFESPGMRDTDREFALSLGPLPLRLARKLTRDDPEISALLRDLEAVRIYIYEINGDSERIKSRMESTAAGLADQGWTPALTVRDDDGLVSALVKMDNDRIQGLAVIAQDHSELILVNLIGQIRPEMFNTYLSGLDIKAPDIEIDPG